MKRFGYPWDVAAADPIEHARKQRQKEAFEMREEGQLKLQSDDRHVQLEGNRLHRRAMKKLAWTLTEEEVRNGSPPRTSLCPSVRLLQRWTCFRPQAIADLEKFASKAYSDSHNKAVCVVWSGELRSDLMHFESEGMVDSLFNVERDPHTGDPKHIGWQVGLCYQPHYYDRAMQQSVSLGFFIDPLMAAVAYKMAVIDERYRSPMAAQDQIREWAVMTQVMDCMKDVIKQVEERSFQERKRVTIHRKRLIDCESALRYRASDCVTCAIAVSGERGGLLHAFPRALQGAPRRVPQGRGDVRGLAPNSGARVVGWHALTQESPQGVRALLRVAPADLCRVRSRRQAAGGHRRRTHGLAPRCRRLQDDPQEVDRLWPRSVATAKAPRGGRERGGHVPAAERAQDGVASYAPHSPVHAEAFPKAPNSPPLGEAVGKASGARDATSEAAACPLNATMCALEMSATDIPPSRSDTVACMPGM